MTSVILDCDPGHDDAVALLIAVASDEIDLLGVTTVAGNQSVERTSANARRILDFIGRDDIPVAAGAGRPLVRAPHFAVDVHGESGLDGVDLPPPSREPESEHAVDWTARTLRSAGGPVTLVATGPLTNVALLLIRYPELEARMDRIVLMGGAIGEGNVTPAAEFNIWADPEAAHRVFASAVPLIMVGLDVTHRALLTGAYLEQLTAGGRTGQLVADLYSFYLPVHRRRYGWDGAPAHDAVAMAQVIDGSLLETRSCGVVIEIGSELSRGRTHVDLRHQMGWEPYREVAVGIDSGRFLQLVRASIGRLG
ncbi:MAG: nucleoside hydrolase [Solirubrobacteraceae bacterium]